jgi:hypothetical protein
MAFLTPAMVMQFHSQKLKEIPGLYHPFLKDFSRIFQDHTSFPGLSRAWKKTGKKFQDFQGLSRTRGNPGESYKLTQAGLHTI